MKSSSSPSFGKRLTWAEPRGFRKAGLKASWKSVFRIIALTAGITFVFIGIATWFDLVAEVTWKLSIAASGIVTLCLLMLVGANLVPFTVKVTEKAIVVYDLGDTPTVYRFGSIDHCEIGNASVGGTTARVLVVALKNGDRETLGIAHSLSTDVLRATLEHRGVSVVTRTDTMSGQTLTDENGDRDSHSTGIQRDRHRT